MKINNERLPSIEELREWFFYDSSTGVITRIKGRCNFTGPCPYDKIYYKELRVDTGRLAWGLYYGEWPIRLVDHKDGDHSNNKIDNLRLATYQQNQFNKVSFGHYPKGVTYKNDVARNNPYQAKIRVNGKRIHLGCFPTMKAAADAYLKAAEEYQGEFAVHNSRNGT